MDLGNVSDDELIAECLRRQLANGRLVASEGTWVGGILMSAGAYSLSYLGPVE